MTQHIATQPIVDEPTVPLESADRLIGSVLADRYLIEALAGTGGMARVYRAHDQRLGRTVALKIFSADSPTAGDLRRQQAEIRTAAGLHHPAIVTLFDITTEERGGGSPVLVMQFVDSDTLRERLQHGAIDPAAAASIGADVADALHYLHDRGIMHRDIKPGNVLLPSQGMGRSAMLSDFGIARMVDDGQLTTAGTVMGSASYLSPEQARGDALTPATDVYSLGLVLIECLSGKRCFPGPALESAAARLSRDPELPEGVDDRWHQLLRRMTARDPHDRPSAAEAAGLLRTMPTASIAETQPVAAPRRSRMPRRSTAIGVAIAVALVGAAAATTWAISSIPAQTPSPGIEYPVVDGRLGDYLQRLQDAVAP